MLYSERGSLARHSVMYPTNDVPPTAPKATAYTQLCVSCATPLTVRIFTSVGVVCASCYVATFPWPLAGRPLPNAPLSNAPPCQS